MNGPDERRPRSRPLEGQRDEGRRDEGDSGLAAGEEEHQPYGQREPYNVSEVERPSGSPASRAQGASAPKTTKQ